MPKTTIQGKNQQLVEDLESERQKRESLEVELAELQRSHRFLKERLSSYQDRQQYDLLRSRREALEKYLREHIEETATTTGENVAVEVLPTLPYQDGGYDEIDNPCGEDGNALAEEKDSKSDVVIGKDLTCSGCHRQITEDQLTGMFEKVLYTYEKKRLLGIKDKEDDAIAHQSGESEHRCVENPDSVENPDYDEIDYAYSLNFEDIRDCISNLVPVDVTLYLSCPSCHQKFKADAIVSLLEAVLCADSSQLKMCGNVEFCFCLS